MSNSGARPANEGGLLCGHCEKPLGDTVIDMQCRFHYACSERCAHAGCMRDCCDVCEEPMKEEPVVLSCGCRVHKACLRRVGFTPAGLRCNWCRTQTEIDAGDAGVGVVGRVTSAFGRAPPLEVPVLSERKMRRHGWTAADLARMPAYTDLSIVRSNLSSADLERFGMDVPFLRAKGFTFAHHVVFLRGEAPGALKENVKKALKAYAPALREVVSAARTAFVDAEDLSAAAAIAAVRGSLGIGFDALWTIAGQHKPEFLAIAPEAVWEGVYGRDARKLASLPAPSVRGFRGAS
jgi:hypothetical protein